jgi:UPF0176 protein
VAQIFHIAFYKFVALDDAELVAARLREIASALTGSVLIAPEGINGVLAGAGEALDSFQAAITADPRFASITFKRTHCTTPPFAKLKIHLKSEIVELGLPNVNATAHQGTRLSPQQWRALLYAPDVVVIDNRNAFEYRLGHFRGAVNPAVDNFRDFPSYVEAHAAHWQREGKRVAMYCTGGIRCEKTSAWMSGLGIAALELDGGILNFLQSMPDAAQDWQGECFVFDNRVALDTTLHETATTAQDVYNDSPDEQWRLARAKRLADAV